MSLLPYMGSSALTEYYANFNKATPDYGSIADASQTGLDITGDMTFETEFNISSAPSSGRAYYFLQKTVGTGNQRSYNAYYLNNSGTLEVNFAVSSDGTSANQTVGTINATLTTGSLQHIAYVYTASAGTCQVYVNGTSIGTMTGLKTSIFNSTAPVTVSRNSTTHGFEGNMSKYRLWSVSRTGTQINDNKHTVIKTATNLELSLINNNSNLDDDSGNGNNMTENGTVTYGVL